MSFLERLQEIEQLHQAIEQHGKIPADTLRKINYKFRLEWNYYSNMIEGNSLTMQETRGIMMNNITVEGKPLKDVLEMKGHDDVISEILRIGKGELNVSEKRIQAIHKGIMHEEDTEKQKLIGIWKTEPNYLYNFKGERFDFTAPGDVKDEMHKLVNWLNGEKEKIARKAKDALHPIQLAFHFHIDYVTIHPFYDGNGRTARILTNLILISFGYPPVYVKDTEKDAYNQYLGEIQTYGGDTELFYTFMAGLLLRSMQLTLDAIEGKMIDEPNDWQKKLRFLINENTVISNTEKYQEKISDVVLQTIIPLFKKLNKSLFDFENLFEHRLIEVSVLGTEKIFGNIFELEAHIFDLSRNIKKELSLSYLLLNYKQGRPQNAFSLCTVLKWIFDESSYHLIINEIETQPKKLFSEYYSEKEVTEIINQIGSNLYHQLESHIKKIES